MVSQIRTRPKLAVSKATIAFEDKERRYLNAGYDVAADGRFLLVEENETYPRQLNLVQNFLEEVKRLVPHCAYERGRSMGRLRFREGRIRGAWPALPITSGTWTAMRPGT